MATPRACDRCKGMLYRLTSTMFVKRWRCRTCRKIIERRRRVTVKEALERFHKGELSVVQLWQIEMDKRRKEKEG